MSEAPAAAHSPSVAYLKAAAAKPTKLETGQDRTKLLIVDLNNCLLARRHRKPSAGRNPLPRPYLSTFLEYIHRSEYKLLVWSSSQPVNVVNMCRAIGILPPEGKNSQNTSLIGIWDRDVFNLTPEDYHRKVAVVKNLEDIFKDGSLGSWNQSNTVMLDDSLHKASLQPFNHLHLPLFDPFDNAHEVNLAPINDSVSQASSFVGRTPALSNAPALRSDVDSWRRTSDWVSGSRPEKSPEWQKPGRKVSNPGSTSAIERSYAARREKETQHKPDPSVFAHFGNGNSQKRKPYTSDGSISGRRYETRSKMSAESTPFAPREEKPTGWPFPAPSVASSTMSTTSRSGTAPIGEPSDRRNGTRAPPVERRLPVGTVPVDLPPSIPSSIAPSIAPSDTGDAASVSVATAGEDGEPGSEWQNDTMLLCAIAALDVLVEQSNISSAIRSGMVATCFTGGRARPTVEERLAALWNDRRSETATATEDDDGMSVTTMTGATRAGDVGEWENRGRAVCARLMVEVRKEFALKQYV